MANQRAVSSISTAQSAQLVIDMSTKVYDLEPNSAPFLKLMNLSKESKRVVDNPEFKHLEQQRIAVRTTASSGYTSASTVVAVADGTIFSAYDYVKNVATAEVMRVTSVSSNNLTVTRGTGETAAAVITSGDSFINLGPGYADGADAGTPLIRPLDSDYNCIQQFRLPYGVDWMMQASKSYSGSELARIRKEKGIEFLRRMELQFLFGERYNSSGVRQTRGLQKFISTNVHAVGGALTQSLFEQYLETDFRYGSDTKVLLASARTITAINGWAQGRVETDTEMSKRFGTNVMTYVSGHGELKIVKHKLLEGTTLSGYAFLVDPDNVRYAYMQGHDVQINAGLAGNGEHINKEEWYAYAGLMMASEKTHAIYTGITS